MTLDRVPKPKLAPAPTAMTIKKIQEKSVKPPEKACLCKRPSLSVPSVRTISSMSPLTSLFVATVHDCVGNKTLVARDHTAQPKQRLANQGKTTTVLVHVFGGLLRLSPVPPHKHTLSGIRVGGRFYVSLFLAFSCRPWCTIDFLRCVPARSFRYRTDVVTVW